MATAGETYFFLGGTRCGVHTILDSRPITLDRLSLHEKKSIYTVTSPILSHAGAQHHTAWRG